MNEVLKRNEALLLLGAAAAHLEWKHAAAVGDGACALVSLIAEMQFLERFAGCAPPAAAAAAVAVAEVGYQLVVVSQLMSVNCCYNLL